MKHDNSSLHNLEMQKHLNIDEEKAKKILDIKLKVFKKELTSDEARKIINSTFDKITPEEFALGEQHLINLGIDDDTMVEGMDDIIDIFRDVLTHDSFDLSDGHPIKTYAKEADALERVVLEIEMLKERKFIKNKWTELYEKLNEIKVHFSRKQNQLFSKLEAKGFDRPSTVMWTFDNKVREAVNKARELLENDKDEAFLAMQPEVIYLVRDILDKERTVLYPTSLKLLSNEEFAQMRISDDEIGYCLIDNPPVFQSKTTKVDKEQPTVESEMLLTDLQKVFAKHGVGQPDVNKEIDVSMGKLTLEQINLIYKHLQVDLSYVDENEIVKFYSDTKHRVFPRSAGVIGRKVQNCHPRESVETVEAIIEAFKKGEQDKAEFWLEIGGKFIYIIYNAVRDDKGNFKGVLEMMQDVTHIRSLTGSRKLLTWDKENKKHVENQHQQLPETKTENSEITKDMTIGKLLKTYPFLKDYLIELNPKYKLLNNPVVFKAMGNIATLSMVAMRGEVKVEELVEKLKTKVQNVKN